MRWPDRTCDCDEVSGGVWHVHERYVTLVCHGCEAASARSVRTGASRPR